MQLCSQQPVKQNYGMSASDYLNLLHRVCVSDCRILYQLPLPVPATSQWLEDP
uniref:Uncharacterized protein n=1 Tax=Arundo donax TaxID=35708 RepID=A0A0A9E719_ARUDO